MCGRFSLTEPVEAVQELFPQIDLDQAFRDSLTPRYNIAPTQPVLAVRAATQADDAAAARAGGLPLEACLLKWGLVPSWAKEPMASPPINARSESAHEKPMFRRAFARRRCLILTDGFYEWGKPPKGSKTKPVYHVRRRDGKPYAMAGLWDRWEGGAGVLESCTILTTTPNELLAPLHDRMSVILPADRWGAWLDPAPAEGERLEALRELLAPYPAKELELKAVSSYVNSVRKEGPRCWDEPAEPARQGTLF